MKVVDTSTASPVPGLCTPNAVKSKPSKLRDEAPRSSTTGLSKYETANEGIKGLRFGSKAMTESSEGSGRASARRMVKGRGTPRGREKKEQQEKAREAVEYIEDWGWRALRGRAVWWLGGVVVIEIRIGIAR